MMARLGCQGFWFDSSCWSMVQIDLKRAIGGIIMIWEEKKENILVCEERSSSKERSSI